MDIVEQAAKIGEVPGPIFALFLAIGAAAILLLIKVVKYQNGIIQRLHETTLKENVAANLKVAEGMALFARTSDERNKTQDRMIESAQDTAAALESLKGIVEMTRLEMKEGRQETKELREEVQGRRAPRNWKAT